MTKHEIGSLSSKLAGIYAWLQALGYFGVFGAVFATRNAPGQITISFIIPVILLGIAGAVLFFDSARISRLLLPSPEGEPERQGSIKASELQTIAFSVVGLAVLVSALPELCNCLTVIYLSSPFSPEGAPVKQRVIQNLPRIVGVVVRLILGMTLFLRSVSLVSWWSLRVAHSAEKQE